MNWKLLSVHEMVSAEKSADAEGHSYREMMEQAGRATAQAMQARFDVAKRRVLILVGAGNNGGDGLVVGRYLAEAGADVTFYLTHPRDPEQDEQYALVQKMGLLIVFQSFDNRYHFLRIRLQITDIIVDALLGTGTNRPIGGELAQLMRQLYSGLLERNGMLTNQNESMVVSLTELPTRLPRRVVVVAVDCPSGLNCDTGEIDPLALSADLTVTFAAPKRGHFIFPAATECGELCVAEIGIAPRHLQSVQTEVATPKQIAHQLPERPADGHKGTFGSLLIAGSSADYWGATILAARAAYRMGCGLVAVAVPRVMRPIVAGQLPEAVLPSLPDQDNLGEDSAEALLPLLSRYRALLVGPGLGTHSDRFLHKILSAEQLPPLVLDADALNWLAKQSLWWERLPPHSILTPHPLEMSRLMQEESMHSADRIELARHFAERWQQIVVLKGAHTVVALPHGKVTLIPIVASALATAGSGDVLAGMIGSLLAQGSSAENAAVTGAYLHALAGQRWSRRNGNAGLLAHEIADELPVIRQQLTTLSL